MSSTKPKVHNVSQRRQRTARATAIGNMHKKLVEIARVVPEIYSRTDRQTDRQTQTHTSILITILSNRYFL